MEVLYQIIFSGEIQEGFDLPTTKESFAKLLKLKRNKVDRLFTGEEFILKEGVDETTAMNCAMAVAKTGCACRIELTPQKDDISLQPDFVEQRKSDRRINRAIRRVRTRKGTGSAGRRDARGRRVTDYAFLQTVEH